MIKILMIIVFGLVLFSACTTERQLTDSDVGLLDGRQVCDARSPCENGGQCISVEGNPAVCFEDDENVCQIACGVESCRIAESYPMQLFC